MRRIIPVLIVLLAGVARADVFYVYPDGSGEYPNIQAAIDAMEEWTTDTIMLGNGIFQGDGNRNLSLIRIDPLFRPLDGNPETCVIDTDDERLFTPFSGANPILEDIGFHDCGPSRPYRGDIHFFRCEFVACRGVIGPFGVEESGIGRFYDCLFRECTGEIAGLGNFYDCLFTDNQAEITRGYCSYYNSTFLANSAPTLFHISGGDTYWNQGYFENCDFIGNSAASLIELWGGGVTLSHCCLFSNTGDLITGQWDMCGGILEMFIEVANCSFVFNHGEGCSDFLDNYGQTESIDIANSVFAFRDGGSVFSLHPDGVIPTLTDCDLYGNAGGDWTGPIADQLGVGCNISANPAFCNWGAGDLTLYDVSPCLPENNDCGVLIGAEGQGCSDPTAVSEAGAPARARLEPNHPNPFNPKTRITFVLDAPALVRLSVHDSSGRLVAVLLDGVRHDAARHGVDWNGRDREGRKLASGVYFARLKAAGLSDEQKMILLY